MGPKAVDKEKKYVIIYKSILERAFGGVAQLGERTVRIRKVESSSLFISTKKVVDFDRNLLPFYAEKP